VESMPQHWNSTLLRCTGAFLVLGLSFFSTLQILNLIDGPATMQSDVPFTVAMNALISGRVMIVQLDDNPAEDRDNNGLIACGPDTAKGYLGALIAGEQYEIVYLSGARSWTTSGPYQVLRTCGRYSETYGPAKLGATKAEPENGELVLWGAVMTFDAKLDVYGSAERKIGHLSIKP
jgi:hypothetical protein